MIVHTYKGTPVDHTKVVRITYGDKAGQYASRYDANLVELASYDYCLKSDSGLHHVVIGFEGAAPKMGYIHVAEDFTFTTDARTGLPTLSHLVRWGLVGVDTYGNFSFGIRSDIEQTSYLDESVAEANNVALDPVSGQWMSRSNPRWGRYVGNGNAPYHAGCRMAHTEVTNDTEWTLGIEVEKEDRDGYRFPYRLIKSKTGWDKERDGSLRDNLGFELISPTYDLMKNTWLTDIEGDENLLTLVNADYSVRCGGHLHVGRKGYSDRELFDEVSPYMPLLYALYPSRVNKDYSQAKGKTAIVCGGKYQAVRMLGNHIELRIFPAVKNVSNLKWRIDLVRIICETGPITADLLVTHITNEDTPLGNHLRMVLSKRAVDHLVTRVQTWIIKLKNESYEASNDYSCPSGPVSDDMDGGDCEWPVERTRSSLTDQDPPTGITAGVFQAFRFA